MEKDYKAALGLCTEILDLLPELPERAESFSASVEEKVLSMKERIEETKTVSPKMLSALENMKAGAEKWMR